MLPLSKPLRRTLRAHQWLALASQPNGLFLFYPTTTLNPAFIHQLFFRYGSLGFTTFFCGHSWATPFWPRFHPALAFLSKGSFVAAFWPSLALWQKAFETFPLVGEFFCGLVAGHFFLAPSAVSQAKLTGPSLLCGTLVSSWKPLVDTLFLLTAQLVSIFPLC